MYDLENEFEHADIPVGTGFGGAVVDGAVIANLIAIGKMLPHLITRPVLNSFYSHNLCARVCARVSAGVCVRACVQRMQLSRH